MPFLSSKLPEYAGPYGAGVVDIEVPVQERRIGSYNFTGTGEPAFVLETVFFSLYYPTTKREVKGKRHQHPWQPRPLSLHAEGYARFARINNWFTNNVFKFALWSLAGSNDIPAEVDARLLGVDKMQGTGRTDSSSDEEDQFEKFPILIFSHGMASGRTSYTQYCGELASRGYVVAAVEHRDGSGPGTIITRADGTKNNLYHFSDPDLTPRPSISELKHAQLAFRQAEMEETYKILTAIDRGEGYAIFQRNARREGKALSYWKGKLDVENLVIAGHSYGATLALQALKGAPASDLPAKGGIILDPGKQSGPLNDDIDVPIVIVNSQSWSAKHTIFHGRPHFDVVKELVEGVVKKGHTAWFLTAKGTTHPSVTDAPLLHPFLLSWTTGATIDVHEGVQQYVKVSDEFMQFVTGEGARQDILRQHVSHPEYNEEAKGSQCLECNKYWQIHVAPDQAVEPV